jgi:hypothetical protein
MRRYLRFVVGAAILGAGLLIWHASRSRAERNQEDAPKAKAPDPLPIRQVVLFNSGVGYFQREGDVDGNARIELSFPTADINDLLKSLILQDLGGGRVSTVSYDSHDPIEKNLRSFALDLSGNPSYGQILNQARGEKVEVLRREKADAQPVKVQGSIVGMEAQATGVGTEQELLNLMGEQGLVSIPLNQVLAIRFLNPILEGEFQRALQVLVRAHDTQKKSVSLGFTGAGKRPVKVGYVVERPIWKTTYRLRLEPNGKLFLQGWALVENTSDDDWNDVRMTLVAGRPISYKMNLYEPLYIPRPTVEPALFASLRPPVYSAAMEGQGVGPTPGMVPPPLGQGALGGQIGAGALGMPAVNFGNQGMQGGAGFSFAGNLGFGGGFGGQLGQFGGQVGQFGGGFVNRHQLPQSGQGGFLWANQQRLTYEELQERRKQKKEAMEEAKKAVAAIPGLNFREGIESVASADDIGDYHRYLIDQKVTLPRQKSAMLPILNQTIEGAKVSIYNQQVHARYPLLGLRLKNTSGKPLTQGPITVYEESNYAGDTRILDLHPGEERLLSYALDQGTEIETKVASRISPEMTVEIGGDKLIAHFKYRETKTYLIKNRSAHDRRVVIEHPVRSGWKMVGAKPRERSREVYRFVVDAPAGKPVPFDVAEEQTRVQEVALSPVDRGPPRFLFDSLEVVPVSKTSLGEEMELKVLKAALHVRHKVREARTYLIHNHSSDEAVLNVKHLVRPGWKLVDGKDADDKGPKFHRFMLTVPPGKQVSREIVEEQLRNDLLALVSGEDRPARYVVGLGVEVQPIVNTTPERLLDVKIIKGKVHARYKVEETTSYVVKNNLETDRIFRFEHLVRPEWKRLEGKEVVQNGPAVHRFTLKLAAGKTGSEQVREDWIYRTKEQPLGSVDGRLLQEYLASSALSAEVKAALEKTLAMSTKLKDAQRQLAELEKQRQTLSDDQSRLRENLKIIPPTAEPYKKFLQKFVDQEVEIENLQRQLRDVQATVKKAEREYVEFSERAGAE